MKSWFTKLLRKESATGSSQLIRLRTARFRHLLRQYGQLIALCADAAEKQSGEYILDRAYVLSLIEKAFETAQGMIYDLEVLAGQRYTGLYDAADSIRQNATVLFKEDSASLSGYGDREEPEYRLLRKIREMLFGREFAPCSDDDPSGTYLFGIVRSIQKLAADSMAGLMRPLTDFRSAGPAQAGAVPPIKTSVVDLMKGLTESNGPLLVSDPFSTDSAAREFLRGFFTSELWKGSALDSADPNSALVACGLEDSMSAVLFHSQGYNLFDVFASCAPESNHFYCRFPSGDKTPVTAGILERLGFSVSRTKDELTGWVSSQPLSEITSKLQVIAGLAVFLLQPHPTDRGLKAEDEVHRFFTVYHEPSG